jgi:hypothetical protein
LDSGVRTVCHQIKCFASGRLATDVCNTRFALVVRMPAVFLVLVQPPMWCATFECSPGPAVSSAAGCVMIAWLFSSASAALGSFICAAMSPLGVEFQCRCFPPDVQQQLLRGGAVWSGYPVAFSPHEFLWLHSYLPASGPSQIPWSCPFRFLCCYTRTQTMI